MSTVSPASAQRQASPDPSAPVPPTIAILRFTEPPGRSEFPSLLAGPFETPKAAGESRFDEASGRRLEHRTDRGTDGPADIEGGGDGGIFDLELGRRFDEQLPGAPADHGYAGGADGMAFGNQAAGRVDGAFAVDARLAVDPVLGAAAEGRLAEHFG